MKMLEMPEYALYEIHESGKLCYMRLELPTFLIWNQKSYN